MEDFLASPSVEGLRSFKKSELLTVADKYELSHVKQSMRKADIQQCIAEYLCDENLFDEEELALFPGFVDVQGSEFELKKLELEERRMQREAEERRMQMQLKEKQLELEKEDREREEKAEERWMQREEKAEERQFELEKLRLKQTSPPVIQERFQASREVRLVPPFDPLEVDKYFQQKSL